MLKTEWTATFDGAIAAKWGGVVLLYIIKELPGQLLYS